MPATRLPQPGQLVLARSCQYLVDAVVQSGRRGDATRVRLSCVDDDNLGAPLEILWEHELDARIAGEPVWQRAREKGFDTPTRFSAYLHALRWNAVTATDPRLFQAPYRAGIEVMAYQLEPLRKALLLPRVNLFIADDVGLGKTIEAGLVLQELIYRQKVRRVVVAAPPSVVPQWREAEFAQQFAKQHWPGERAPRLYYDPRGLALEKKDRAVLHAKCIIADTAAAFVSSANLTDAAQYRNVEAGVLVEDTQFAKRLRRQFDVLVEHGRLKSIPWPSAWSS